METQDAIHQLARSERGRHALRVLLDWLDDGGIALDQRNQQAVMTLLYDAWRRPGSTRDLMRDALATA